MIGKAFGDHRSAHPLALEIDLGDEIDRALLVDVKAGRATRQLDGAGTKNDFDGGGEEEDPEGSLGVRRYGALRAAGDPLHHDDFHARLGARCRTTSSMKLRIRKMPRPLAFRMFSGASGSETMSRDRTPRPSSRTRMTMPAASRVERRELDVHPLASSPALPCLMALMTDSRTATPTQCRASSSRPASAPEVIAHDLYEVEHLERAVEVEMDCCSRWSSV